MCSGRGSRSSFWSQNMFNISVIFINSIIVFRRHTLHRPRIIFSRNSRIIDEWLLAVDLWVLNCLILTNIFVHKFLHNLTAFYDHLIDKILNYWKLLISRISISMVFPEKDKCLLNLKSNCGRHRRLISLRSILKIFSYTKDSLFNI